MRKTRKVRLPRADQLGRVGLAGRLSSAAVLLILTAAIVFGLVVRIEDRDRAAAEAATAVAGPSTMTKDGLVRVGSPDAKVVVTVVEDPQCPLCRSFESATGPALDALVAKNAVSVDYDLVAIRDRSSTTAYSSRAANAGACVAAADIGKWPVWRRELLNQVPAEGSPGPSDQDLIDLAARIGITPTPQLTDCVTTHRYRAYVANQTEKAIAAKLTHAPAVRIGTSPVTNLTPEGIDAAVRAATARQVEQSNPKSEVK
ncbi:DsbA family protein [Nocardia sp. NPDC088792]|uniref:DsbA family protein n=1 Tax=Nocardia sp. NPDC088792 TaxID=3364332 RepID=UPI00382A9AE0